MANTIRVGLRNVLMPLLRDGVKLPNVLLAQTPRHLYAKTTLGLDSFQQQQQYTNSQMATIGAKFREKMVTYSDPESKTMIFTEDLKNMIHLAASDEDINLVVNMMKKFNSQNKQLRFGNFVFGPVVMRMFHIYNKADLALECFNSPELEGFFDQIISYQVLMDLLYENGKYNEVLKLYETIKGRQLHEIKYPRNVIVLTLAACYKLNTPESFKYASDVWAELKEAGHYPMRRATTFMSGLALNQGCPEVALEVIASLNKQNYVTIRNTKVKALCQLGRLDDALVLLKSILSEDFPENAPKTFSRDVMETAKAAVLKADNPDISLDFNRLEKLFEKEGHISNTTLDEQLCSEIQPPAMINKRQENRFGRYQPAGGRYQSPVGGRDVRYRERPGLKDMM